jgi:copper(I)-binding protein/putative intracellular protease/amidase/DNA-directed RNA polymerase subunit RPC12/RpoP
MKKHVARLIMAVLIAWVWIGVECPGTFAVQSSKKAEYVCPPCGCDKDDQTFDAPGVCTSCGMRLVEKGSSAARPVQPQPEAQRKQVAILIFDGVQIIDYTGPYEVFGQAGFNVFTVAEKSDPITTAMGMRVTPSFTFADSPEPNIVVIPGGNVLAPQSNPAVLKWIQDRAPKAEYVMSVCNGAYILARTGLLDGLTATTFHGLIDGLVAIAPKTKVVRDRRFVDNGKIITTAGLSSGIDGSMHVVSKILGRGRAQAIALNLEYNWQPDLNYARAALADMRMRFSYEGIDAMSLSREGGTDQWENRWLVRSELSSASVLEQINKTLATDGKWAKVSSDNSSGATSLWKFVDEQGRPWSGAATVQPLAGEKNRHLMIVRISRGELKEAAAADPNKIVIKDAWIQEPPSQQATAAFFVIENHGPKEVALISAKAELAAATELHQMETVNDVMRMRKVYLIPVAAGDSTSLDSKTGYHVMLINLSKQIKEGEKIQLTLQFSNSAQKTITVPVKKRGMERAATETER